jgi:ABC-type Na+ efflux pump permease subunit
LGAIFYAQLRVINVGKWLTSIAACVCLLILTYSFSPPGVRGYLEKRVEFRVKQGEKQDRFALWGRAMDYFLEHPGGVGLTLTVGDRVKTVIHNDYLAYTVSYSIMGGLAYTSLVAGLLISFFLRRKSIIDDPSAFAVYLAGLGVIVVVAVNSMTDHMTVNRWYFNVIWSVIWYSYFCSRDVQIGSVRQGMRSETVIAGTEASHGKSVPTFT